MDEEGTRNGASLSEEAHCGEARGRSLLMRYETKALGTGISLHGNSVGQTGLGSSSGNFERWLKGALDVGRLSVWELCEGSL
jgi:hypothetical protein